MTDRATSYPREKIKILLLENVSEAAAAEFRAGGYASVTRLAGALGEAELAAAGVAVFNAPYRDQLEALGARHQHPRPVPEDQRGDRLRHPRRGPHLSGEAFEMVRGVSGTIKTRVVY